MKLIVGPIYTNVEGDFIEIQGLNELLVAPDEDGESRSLFQNNCFYTGLLGRVEDILKAYEIEYEIEWTFENRRRDPRSVGIHTDFLPGIELRPHQIAAATKLIANGGRGVVNMATGAGKSEVACVAAKHLGLKTVFVNDRVNAMEQAASRFRKYGIDCGMLGGGHNDIHHQVTSAVVDTLYTGVRDYNSRVLDLMRDTQLLIFDEVHHLSSMSWTFVGENCPAPCRSGLSASVFNRPDERYYEDMMLIGQTGEVVCFVPPRWLIDRNYLAEPLIHWIPVNTLRPRTMEWHKVYSEGVVRNTYLNYLVAGAARHFQYLGYKVLVLVQRIEHGNRILQLINDPTVIFSYGGSQIMKWDGRQIEKLTMSPEDLRQSFELQSSGIIVGSTVYDEAIDLPSMNVLIMAGGGKNFRRTIQRIGRPLHSKDEFVHVLDFWYFNHPYLQKHSKERSDIYSRLEYRQFQGVQELNRRLPISIDLQHILMQYQKLNPRFLGEFDEPRD